MAIITLYCQEAPSLKLGPGDVGTDRCIEFVSGYVDLDTEDPLFDLKMSWVGSRGAPPIRVLEPTEAPVVDPNALPCPVCGKTFKTKKAVDGHLLGAHR